jgi:hypothetical protein
MSQFPLGPPRYQPPQPESRYPLSFPDKNVKTPEGTVALDAYVQYVVNAINSRQVIPLGDYGGPNIYLFQTFDNGLGNLVYTIFDKATTLGLASFMVRYGAEITIRQALFAPMSRSQIPLQFVILPCMPTADFKQGSVTP